MSAITAVLPVLMIPKDINIFIGYNLHHYEFACRCTWRDCTYTLISPSLISAWDSLRRSWGKELSINSGFRCQRHNAKKSIKGLPHSRHKAGQAIDIHTGGMLFGQRKEFIELARLHFDIVVVYDSFIHCHIEDDINDRLWTGQF